MILSVTSKPVPTLNDIAKDLLGQTVYIEWPHLLEAYVIGVTDLKTDIFLKNFWQKYNKDNLNSKDLNKNQIAEINQELVSFVDK